MSENNESKTGVLEPNLEQPSQEIAQGNEPVRPRRGRPRNPVPEVASIGQINAEFEALQNAMVERPEAELMSEKELNDHNKKLLRQLQIILSEDFRMMNLKNNKIVPTPNGVAKFELGGLTPEQRKHAREMYKILVTSVKLFDEGGSNNPNSVQDLAKQLYKGIPGLKT